MNDFQEKFIEYKKICFDFL